jgi:hypothetical protein
MAHVPPSEEVEHQEAVDHLATCMEPGCVMWRTVQAAIVSGTPGQRLALWRMCSALVDDLAPHVMRDSLGDL